jgi:hypothetical protein
MQTAFYARGRGSTVLQRDPKLVIEPVKIKKKILLDAACITKRT